MKGKYFFEPKRDLFWKTNQGTRGLCYALCTVVYSVTVGLPAWLLLVTVQLKLSPLKYIFKSHLFIGVCVCASMYMWGQRTPFWCWVSPSTVWVSGMHLRPAGLEASTCTCCLNFSVNILHTVILKVIYVISS